MTTKTFLEMAEEAADRDMMALQMGEDAIQASIQKTRKQITKSDLAQWACRKAGSNETFLLAR